MKNIIVSVILLFVATIAQGQQSLYEALQANGETAIYEGFFGLEANGDGTYNFTESAPAVNIAVIKLPTGQPVGFNAKSITETYGDFSETELSDNVRSDSYPSVIYIKHQQTKKGYMAIDDLFFVLERLPKVGNPTVNNITKVYVMVKDRPEVKETKKNNRGGFFARMKAKIEAASVHINTPAFRYLRTVDIDQKFNDYVSVMKLKQTNTLTSKDSVAIATIKRAREKRGE